MAEQIHPSAIIGRGVVLGREVVIGPGVVLMGRVRVGDRAHIGAGSVIGGAPEIRSPSPEGPWDDVDSFAGVEIDDDVTIRETVTIQQGSERATRIGAGTWILSGAYIAHDVRIEDGCTISAGAALAGYVTIGGDANLGMNAAVHQRRVIGPGAMVGMGAVVTADVPPLATVYGSPARIHGVNRHLAARSGWDDRALDALEAAYRGGDVLLRAVPASTGRLEEHLRWWTTAGAARPARLASVPEDL